MVSFQEQLKFEIISQKKRRWQDNIHEVGAEKDFFKKISKVDHNNDQKPPSTKSLFFDEYINFFRLEKPSDDRRNQSAEKIQHYNTKNSLEKIISTTTPWNNKDPIRKRSSSSDKLEMGLDLELNLLPYDDSLKTTTTTTISTTDDHKCSSEKKNTSNNDDDAVKVKRCPSWMSFNNDQEMVAAACMRCHMLVMLCKSSPCCPNCKFMHPPNHHQSPTNLFKPKFSLKG